MTTRVSESLNGSSSDSGHGSPVVGDDHPQSSALVTSAFSAFVSKPNEQALPMAPAQLPSLEHNDAATAALKAQRQKHTEEKNRHDDQLQRTLVLTNIAVKTRKDSVLRSLCLLLGVSDYKNHTSIEAVYFRAVELSVEAKGKMKRIMAVSKGQVKDDPGATKIAFVRFQNPDCMERIMEKSGRFLVDRRHIFIHQAAAGHPTLSQPRSIFITGLTNKAIDIEVVLTYLENKLGLKFSGMRTFWDKDAGTRLSYLMLEIMAAMFPLKRDIYNTIHTFVDETFGTVTFKIMKCLCEKKALKRKEKRDSKYAHEQAKMKRRTPDIHSKSMPKLLKSMGGHLAVSGDRHGNTSDHIKGPRTTTNALRPGRFIGHKLVAK